MSNALIGYSGFVGSTLFKQTSFESLYRSTDISSIQGKSFDMIVCAGASAQKWTANLEPATDWEKIAGLIEHLRTVKCRKFVLISTVDVFKSPVDVDEDTVVDKSGLNAYGLHRRILEEFVEEHFSNHLIVRLPGLIGPGLRKNTIFDFLNNNNLHLIDSRAKFQFYPMVNLWYDIQAALNAELKLIHLTAEPLIMKDLLQKGFGKAFSNFCTNQPAYYDIRTRHAQTFGLHTLYQYEAHEVIQAVRCYAQSEPLLDKSTGHMAI